MMAYEIRNTHAAHPLSRHLADRVRSAKWMAMQDLPGIPKPRRHVMIRHTGANGGRFHRAPTPVSESPRGPTLFTGHAPAAEEERQTLPPDLPASTPRPVS